MYARTGAALLFMLMTGASALAADERYPNLSNDQLQGTEDEQSACMSDAMKLCENEIPARAAVLKCLQANRRALTKECRDVLRSRGR